MNEINVVSSLFQALPQIVNSLNKCDELRREHEDKMKLKYSKQEFLSTTLAMYRAGNITAEQAKEAMSMVFQAERTVEVKPVDPVEQQLLNLLGLDQ